MCLLYRTLEMPSANMLMQEKGDSEILVVQAESMFSQMLPATQDSLFETFD